MSDLPPLIRRFQSCLNLHLTKTLVIQKEAGDLEAEIERDLKPPRERSLSEVKMYINTSGLRDNKINTSGLKDDKLNIKDNKVINKPNKNNLNNNNNNNTSSKNNISTEDRLLKLKYQYESGEKRNRRKEMATHCKDIPSYVKTVIMNSEREEPYTLNLPCTAREMREILGSKKRRDPRIINKMDFRRKLEIVQTL